MHGARDVHHKDVVTRRNDGSGYGLGWLDHGQKEVLVTALVEHHAGLNAVTGQPVVQDEVAVVGGHSGVFQADYGRAAFFPVGADVVGGGMHLLDAHGGVQRHVDVEGGRRHVTLTQHGLAHPGGTRLTGLRAVVARPHHGGKHKLVVATGGYQQLGVAQFDLHIVAGQDVGHVHLEDVGQMLFQQRSRLAFLPGGVVFDAGLLLLADFGGDQPVGQTHVHAMHGGSGGTRKYVFRLDDTLAFVPVVLCDRDVRDDAGDAHIDLGGLQRQLIDCRVVTLDEEIGALGLQAGCVTVLRLGGLGDQRQKTCRSETGGGYPQPSGNMWRRCSFCRLRGGRKGERHDAFSGTCVRRCTVSLASEACEKAV